MDTPQQTLESRILSREWFYEFPLPSGQFTRSYLPDFVKSIHTGREKMLFDFLSAHVGGKWQDLSCLDLACHEGYFALKLALKGCRKVVGVDARPEHIANAALMQEIYRLQNLAFCPADVQRLDVEALGVFDIVLVFGILYHVHDLIGTLRNARAVTGGVCLIETQIAPELSGYTEWGSREWTRQIRGCLALVDETDDLESGSQEAGLTSVSVVPSLNGLLFLLGRAGFRNVEILKAGPGAHEQHQRGQRVLIAAFPDSGAGEETSSLRF